jgi:hypothetical protein
LSTHARVAHRIKVADVGKTAPCWRPKELTHNLQLDKEFATVLVEHRKVGPMPPGMSTVDVGSDVGFECRDQTRLLVERPSLEQGTSHWDRGFGTADP